MNKKALGKGLDALFSLQDVSVSNAPVAPAGERVDFLDISVIVHNPDQPRKKINMDEIEELADSIKSNGVIQPIVVIKKDDHYMIVAGERRYLASKKAGLTKIPAIIKSFSDEEILEIALIENIQRSDLNALEEALAFNHLIDKYSVTHEDLAKKLGKSRVYITNTSRILKLPVSVKTKVMDGKLSKGHAITLLQLENEKDIADVAEKIEKEQLSVRETEQLVKKYSAGETVKKEREKQEDPDMKTIEEKLMYKYNTKVSIKGSVNKGKIVIEYYNREQLEQFLS